jgi:hypothetical protein
MQIFKYLCVIIQSGFSKVPLNANLIVPFEIGILHWSLGPNAVIVCASEFGKSQKIASEKRTIVISPPSILLLKCRVTFTPFRQKKNFVMLIVFCFLSKVFL